jgi:hypothetical protein
MYVVEGFLVNRMQINVVVVVSPSSCYDKLKFVGQEWPAKAHGDISVDILRLTIFVSRLTIYDSRKLVLVHSA